jgi:hypothetical protein
MKSALITAAAGALAIAVFATSLTAPAAQAEWCTHWSGKKKVPCGEKVRAGKKTKAVTGTGKVKTR